MFACCMRSGLIVNDETPASYLPEPTPAMIESNGDVSNCAFRPSFCATSVNRSTSKPTMVEPSSARNSFGGYVVSLPTLITPSDAIESGTCDASAWSAETLGSAELLLALPPDDESDEPPPQAVSASVAAATAATPARRVRQRAITTASPSSMSRRDGPTG